LADLTNRSRYVGSVKNRGDLTRHFSFNQVKQLEAYVAELRSQQLKPHVNQLDESWLVRIREKGHKPQNATFRSRQEAEQFLAQTDAERQRGLFADYTASLKVSFAELVVRYLLEEAPSHKSHQILAYSLEGWLDDSGADGARLLEDYRAELRNRGMPVREVKFKMRKGSKELAWIHKPLAKITTVDIKGFINERLKAVEPSTVDRDIDRLKDIFKVATQVWGYTLAKNPMDAVRRTPYFNERDRRISEDEEARLLAALAQLDTDRAVEAQLRILAAAEMEGRAFSSGSARKKVFAQVRNDLRATAECTADVVPTLQVFYYFQVMTAARRGEALGLTWDRIDFAAKTAFLPETKNGRPRKLALRQDLLDLLQTLPREGEAVFSMGLDYLVGAWGKACEMAGISDLHIHDARHEGLSRLAESGKFTLPELQVFSGHRDLRMLMRYAHLCSSRLARKLDECFKGTDTVHVHRGRRFLNRAAGVKPSMFSDSGEQEITSTATPAVIHDKPTNVIEFRPRRVG
jgi:integrase